ncbi:MAG: hypothetical protein EXS14_06005 [Planctomycetes bacterium]|nr:hypothetical protein [Planctomycetota bacterium]
MTLAIILMLVAFLLVTIECFIPSFGLLGILAATAYAFALMEAFAVEAATGWTFVGLGVVLLPLALLLGFRVLPKTPVGRALILQPPTPSKAVHAVAVGARGQTLTDLRPAGAAEFAGSRIDVVSSGTFIAQATLIRVLSVEGTRIVVAPTPEEN